MINCRNLKAELQDFLYYNSKLFHSQEVAVPRLLYRIFLSQYIMANLEYCTFVFGEINPGLFNTKHGFLIVDLTILGVDIKFSPQSLPILKRKIRKQLNLLLLKKIMPCTEGLNLKITKPINYE